MSVTCVGLNEGLEVLQHALSSSSKQSEVLALQVLLSLLGHALSLGIAVSQL